MRNIAHLGLGLLMGLAPQLTSAEDIPDPVEVDNTVSLGLKTPHLAWGKGYAKGKVRALFFLRGLRGDKKWIATEGCGRPIVELAQRFDIEPKVVYMGLREALHGKKGEERAVRLLERDFDVFVTNTQLGLLSPKAQYYLLSQIRDGAGLVSFGPRMTEVMTEAREMPRPLPSFLSASSGLTFLPKWSDRSSDASAVKGILRCYRLGDGRGVQASFGLDDNFSLGALAHYDYRALFLGRVILWAAGRESDVSLTEILGETREIPRAELPRTGLAITLRNSLRKALRLTLALTVRREDGWCAELPNANVELPSRGKRTISVELPVLCQGRYALSVIARSERGVETFGANSFTVTSTCSIKSVTMAEEFVEAGGAISGEVELSETPPEGARLHVQLRDSYNRVLAVQELDLGRAVDSKVSFSVRTTEWCTILMRAQAVLSDARGEIARAEAKFNVPRRGRGRFNFVSWDYPRRQTGYYGATLLRDAAGFSVGLSQSTSHPMVAACNMPYIPYTTHIKAELDENGVMKPGCWNDEGAAEKRVNETAEKYQPARRHGAFVYSLGDEVSTSGCCLSSACLRAYRAYLKDQYGTIDALNRSWGSDYESFDAVNVLEEGDNLEKAALQAGLYARWYDRQAFARYNMAMFCARFHRAFKERDPRAITGFEGAGRFGDDYELIIETNGFWTPYPGIGDEIVRSLVPRGYIHGNWTGYSKHPGSLMARNWRTITRGYDSIWWWRWDGAGHWRGYLQPDLDFWPATRALTEEMRIVREGLGDLLIQCDMPHSGVAILYSMPSYFTNNLEKSGDFGNYTDAHSAWVYPTLDCQIPFRYTTRKRVANGDLKTNKLKILVLPFTQAVGPAEVKAFREFVEAGGTLIADLRPGLYDHHCKPQMPGVLDELFGVMRGGREGAKEVTGSVEFSLGGERLSLQVDKALADADVQPTTAQPLCTVDGVPLVMRRQVGKGMTLLLNFGVTYNTSERHLESSDAMRSFVRTLYAAAGVRSPVVLKARDGGPARATEISRFRTGDVELMSVMIVRATDWTVAQDLTIQLPEEKHVYDLRERKYLGQTRKFSAAIGPARATFFALLPWKAEKLAASLDKTEAKAGDVVTLKLSLPSTVGKPGMTSAYVQGSGGTGGELPYLRDVVPLKNGEGSFRFPVPFNQEPGKFTLRATELISGETVETVCEVVPE